MVGERSYVSTYINSHLGANIQASTSYEALGENTASMSEGSNKDVQLGKTCNFKE